MLLIRVGMNTARYDPGQISSDFKAVGVQVVVVSVLLVEGTVPGREMHILEMNGWLHRWCQQAGLDFLDHWVLFWEGGLLRRDGVYLTKKRKNIFTH